MSTQITLFRPQNWATKIKSSFNSFIEHHLHHEPNELDCTIRANALSVLSLTEEDAKVEKTLDEQYGKLMRELSIKITQAESSKPIVDKLTKMQKRVEISYQTLSKGVTDDSSGNTKG